MWAKQDPKAWATPVFPFYPTLPHSQFLSSSLINFTSSCLSSCPAFSAPPVAVLAQSTVKEPPVPSGDSLSASQLARLRNVPRGQVPQKPPQTASWSYQPFPGGVSCPTPLGASSLGPRPTLNPPTSASGCSSFRPGCLVVLSHRDLSVSSPHFPHPLFKPCLVPGRGVTTVPGTFLSQP